MCACTGGVGGVHNNVGDRRGYRYVFGKVSYVFLHYLTTEETHHGCRNKVRVVTLA